MYTFLMPTHLLCKVFVPPMAETVDPTLFIGHGSNLFGYRYSQNIINSAKSFNVFIKSIEVIVMHFENI